VEEMHVREGRRGGEGRRVGEMRLSEGRTSARSSTLTAGDSDAHVSRRGVTSGRSGALDRSLSSGRGTSGTGATRRGGSDNDEEKEVRGGDLGETAKCRSGRRRGLYRNPPPFATGCVPNRD
jgi:hypothetical protein